MQELVIEKVAVRVIKRVADEGYLMTRDRCDMLHEKREAVHRQEVSDAIQAAALVAAEKVMAAARVTAKALPAPKPTRTQRIIDATIPAVASSLATAFVFWILFIYKSHPITP